MCLILFSWNSHPKYKLIVAANRDEFYARPTASADFWKDYPTILAGRDLKAGGTWLGIEKSGYFTALTNFRDMDSIKENAASRGDLTKNFLINKNGPISYLKAISKEKDKYNDFSLLASDFRSLYYYTNIKDQIIKLDSGIYGLSNHLLDTPWPKVKTGKEIFKSITQSDDFSTALLFELLKNVDMSEDTLLPNTGVPKELERALSSIFIKTPDYGTYCSTVLLVDRNGNCDFEERTYNPNKPPAKKHYSFTIPLEENV